MILVNKDKILYFKKKKYRCSVGLNGFTKNKIEGDKKTPIGTYSFGKLFVRTDKIKNLNTKFKYIPIRKDMAWSDDPNKSNYNNLIKTKNAHLLSTPADVAYILNWSIETKAKPIQKKLFVNMLTNSFF